MDPFRLTCSVTLQTMKGMAVNSQKRSTTLLLLIAILVFDIVFAGTTAAPAPTTTKEPFIKSTMFIGLAAGIGGFLAFGILCCIVWKCFCGGDKND